MDPKQAMSILQEMARLEEEKSEALIQGDVRRLQILVERELPLADRLEAIPESVFTEEMLEGFAQLMDERKKNRALLEQAINCARYSLDLISGSGGAGVYTPQGVSRSKGENTVRVNTQA